MKYQVHIRPDPESGWWVAEVRDKRAGCVTQGRSLAQVRVRVREALAAALDDDEAAADAELVEKLDVGEVRAEATKVARARQRALDAQQGYADALLDAVRRCAAEGYSMRDSAEILGVSHQRVQQLLAQASEGGRLKMEEPSYEGLADWAAERARTAYEAALAVPEQGREALRLIAIQVKNSIPAEAPERRSDLEALHAWLLKRMQDFK